MQAHLVRDPLQWLDTIEPGIEAVLAHGHGEEEVRDVEASLLAGRYLLWLLLDPEYRGFILTERLGGRLPRVNLAHMFVPQGLDEAMTDVWPQIEAHARSCGCEVVEFTSSRAFHRGGPDTGFNEAYRTYRREVSGA